MLQALTANEDRTYTVATGLAALGILGVAFGIRTLRGIPQGDPGCSLEAYKAKISAEGESTKTAERAYKYMPYVTAAAEKWGVPPHILAGLVHTESKWSPVAGSSKGAVGLAQLLEGTANDSRNRMKSNGDWPFGSLNRKDPAQSAWLGAYYLHRMLRERDMEHALAAYNAGPGRIKQGDAPDTWPQETQKYVPAVLRRAQWYYDLWDNC